MIHEDAKTIFYKFLDLSGSYAIASPPNLSALLSYCKESRPIHILELGGGIGTLSYAALGACDATIHVYEENEFCRSQIKENLGPLTRRVSLIDSYDKDPPLRRYDLVIIDGPDCESLRERDEYTRKILSQLSEIRCIFIEGSRYNQRRISQKVMSNLTSFKIKQVRSAEFEDLGLVKGGLFVIAGNKSNFISRKVDFVFSLLKDVADFRDKRRMKKVIKRLKRPIETLKRQISGAKK